MTYPGEYNKYPSQQSKPIVLQAGQKYYIEALQAQAAGGDNLSVAWKMPDGTMEAPIAGSHLIPFEQSNTDITSRTNETAISTTDDLNLNVSINAYPNPFVSKINIACTIVENDKYSLQVYNLQGMLVQTIFSGNLKTGIAKFELDGSKLSGGMYVCRLTSAKKVVNKQITLLKVTTTSILN